MIGFQKGRCGGDDVLAGFFVCDKAENVIGYEMA